MRNNKLFKRISKRKVLKIDTLYNYLTKKCKYSNEQVDNFFEAVDISIYSPLIQGTKKTTR
jgi:hypothetical protein